MKDSIDYAITFPFHFLPWRNFYSVYEAFSFFSSWYFPAEIPPKWMIFVWFIANFTKKLLLEFIAEKNKKNHKKKKMFFISTLIAWIFGWFSVFIIRSVFWWLLYAEFFWFLMAYFSSQSFRYVLVNAYTNREWWQGKGKNMKEESVRKYRHRRKNVIISNNSYWVSFNRYEDFYAIEK